MFHGDSVRIKDDDKENIYLDVEKMNLLLDEVQTTNKLLKYFIAPLIALIQILLILVVYK